MKLQGMFKDALRTERRLRRIFEKSDLPPEQDLQFRQSLEELSRGLMKIRNKIDRLIGMDPVELSEEGMDLKRADENRLKLLVENSPDVVFQQDPELRYTWILGDRMHGFAARDILGKTDFDLFSPEEAKRLSAAKKAVIRTLESVRVEDLLMIKGKEHYFDSFYRVWRGDKGETLGITGYMRDVTERKLAEMALETSEQKFQELSIRDPLSGLYNLRYFYETLKNEVERVNRYHFPLSILMLDIDHFKSINDRYGHYEGDHVLKRTGEIIKRYIRQVDSAYRFGGEEFAVILPETESEEAIQVAERIRLGFKSENFSPKIDEKANLTVSIGVARYFPKEELIAFLKRVDDNLYQAKSQGRDRVYYQEKGGESSFLM